MGVPVTVCLYTANTASFFTTGINREAPKPPRGGFELWSTTKWNAFQSFLSILFVTKKSAEMQVGGRNASNETNYYGMYCISKHCRSAGIGNRSEGSFPTLEPNFNRRDPQTSPERNASDPGTPLQTAILSPWEHLAPIIHSTWLLGSNGRV